MKRRVKLMLKKFVSWFVWEDSLTMESMLIHEGYRV